MIDFDDIFEGVVGTAIAATVAAPFVGTAIDIIKDSVSSGNEPKKNTSQKELAVNHEHDSLACDAMLAYEMQADRQNALPITYFAEKYGKTRRELMNHDQCIKKRLGIKD